MISKLGMFCGKLVKSILYIFYWFIISICSCSLSLILEFVDKLDAGIEDIKDIWRGYF